MFEHQPLVVHPCVRPRRTCCHTARRMMNGWPRNPHKYVRYNTANNVLTFGGDPVTQLIVNVYQTKFIPQIHM